MPLNFLSGSYFEKLNLHDGHCLFIAFIFNGLYGFRDIIEAQIGCLEFCNSNISLRRAFRPYEYLESHKNMDTRRFWTIK